MVDTLGEIRTDIDRCAFRIAARVSFRGQDDPHHGLVTPSRSRNSPCIGNGLEDIKNVAFQAREDDFCLGVTETGIEFNDFDARRRLHQAAVEDAGERRSRISHGIGDRLEDLRHRKVILFVRNERQATFTGSE